MGLEDTAHGSCIFPCWFTSTSLGSVHASALHAAFRGLPQLPTLPRSLAEKATKAGRELRELRVRVVEVVERDGPGTRTTADELMQDALAREALQTDDADDLPVVFSARCITH